MPRRKEGHAPVRRGPRDASRFRLLGLLADGEFHSGQQLADALGISRAAVWKAICALKRDQEIPIEVVRGQGYRWLTPFAPLDAEAIRGHLGTAVGALGELTVHPVIGSTNQYLLERPRPAAGRFDACLAETQTAGRGRQGRAWHSPFGCNLYGSAAFSFDAGPGALAGFSLIAAIAAARALTELGVAPVGLKWPNDLLLQGRKLGGILVEASGESTGPWRVVVGMGLNVRMPDPESGAIDQPWIDLHGAGYPDIDRNRLAGRLLAHLWSAKRQFDEHGFSPFRPEWRRHDVVRGRSICLQSGDKRIQGVATEIRDDGALGVRLKDGRLCYYTAGEISVRHP